MIRIDANKLFDEGRRFHQGVEVPKDLAKAEKIYHQILNKNLGNPQLIYCLGTVYLEQEKIGLGMALLEDACRKAPDFGEAWQNLAMCHRAAQDISKADECLKEAERLLPGIADVPGNRAAIRINQGRPAEVVHFADRALAIEPDNASARWNKALALLEMQKFDTDAWDLHEARLSGMLERNTARRNYHGPDGQTPDWDGKSKGFLVIHGEQGLGDEIMFASCIPDAIETGCDILFEPCPRMAKLFERSFPDIRVVGTHAVDGSDWLAGRLPDFKIAVGSLPKYFRRSLKAFPKQGAILKPDPKKAEHWKDRLRAIGPRRKIGIGWQGGVEQTSVHLRSFPLEMFKPVLEMDADFISVQYHDHAHKEAAAFTRDTGLALHHWPEAAQAKDMDDQAALVSQLDLVITVCQTLVHVSGALDVPCWCLTPSRPSWRYGVTGNMPWWPSVDLIRQKGDDWQGVVDEVVSRLAPEMKDVA